MTKALVLSSGGVDSTTCLSMAVKTHGAENVSTVSIFYGQKLKKEILCARKLAEFYKVGHYEFDLSDIYKSSNCSLLEHGQDVVHKDYASQIENGGVITSYVPFRNGMMLSVCAVLAQSLWPDEQCLIYLGNHASDYAYADCSEAFVEKMDAAISEGTYHKVRFISPLKSLTKAEVVAEGIKLGTPYELTWSCYEGGEKPCRTCGSCIDRIKAFEANGIADPTLKD